ncbi:hypothetical protein [Pustulibacterium marinum]|nr:hypothetical protein [Pustulibacterium marinum]
MICEGDYGFWEVSPEKEVVWKYKVQDQLLWRAYDFLKSSDKLTELNIEN